MCHLYDITCIHSYIHIHMYVRKHSECSYVHASNRLVEVVSETIEIHTKNGERVNLDLHFEGRRACMPIRTYVLTLEAWHPYH